MSSISKEGVFIGGRMEFKSPACRTPVEMLTNDIIFPNGKIIWIYGILRVDFSKTA